MTAILFAQQASRFAELLLSIQIPFSLVSDVAVALIPNALVFTLPMSVLAGTLIGFSRMGSDSELVAMSAAGVGTWRLLWPALLLGLLCTFGAFYINLEASPHAARGLRRAVLRAAIVKLDSPVDPRSFYTEIPRYVVYVRDGDKAQGQWGRVFIFSKETDGSTRLVTARNGRIDSAGETSELVLSDAEAARLPGDAQGERSYVIERLSQLRILFPTGRSALLARLRSTDLSPEELDWKALYNRPGTATPVEAREMETLFHKRLALSCSTLVFALLGAALGLRVRKGGRGLGALLSLLIMIAYYLLLLFGEQMARGGKLSPLVGAWMATALATLCALGLLALNTSLSLSLGRPLAFLKAKFSSHLSSRRQSRAGRVRLINFPSLLDINVLRTLSLSFSFAYLALISVFLIFTLFELWRFIINNGASARLVARYLFFLLPLVSVQILPATVLIAILVTYALMARRSEAIAWWASGQSVYRLILPCLLFASCMGLALWLIQDRLMPQANLLQDALRTQIKDGVSRATAKGGRQWLASAQGGRLYAYDFDEGSGALKEPFVFDFDAEGVHLQRLVIGRTGRWEGADKLLIEKAETVDFSGTGGIAHKEAEWLELTGSEPPNVFKPTTDKPSQLSA
ncbi:MAG: LptF/LptG family permease, partial [Pyrinomonadaceae bacterium]